MEQEDPWQLAWLEEASCHFVSRAKGQMPIRSSGANSVLIELSLPFAVVCTSAKLSLINMVGNVKLRSSKKDQ
jgi:hypothetical protein